MNSRKWQYIVGLGVVVAIAAGFALYAFQGAISASLKAMNLVPVPERFTELYFQNPETLPRTIADNQPISFAFVIRNMEGTSTAYPYQVYFQYPNGNRVLFASDTIALDQNASTSIAVSESVPTGTVVGKVVVNLPTQNDQQIDFLLPDTN